MTYLKSGVRRIYGIIWSLVDLGIVVLCTTMVVSVFLQVIFRYVLHLPLSWSEELARYVFVWLTMLGAAVATKRRSHFALTWLVRRFPRRFEVPLAVLVNFLLLAFLFILVKEGLIWVVGYSDIVSPAMQIGYFWVFAAVPVSAALIAIEVALQTAAAVAGIRNGDPTPSGGPHLG